jgi:16S rRNA (cytosine967-C5)-methyltransferase
MTGKSRAVHAPKTARAKRHVKPPTIWQTVAHVLAQATRWSEPLDAVLAEAFRAHRHLGSRDRALVGDVVYAVARRWLSVQHRAQAATTAHPDSAPPTDALRWSLVAWPEDRLELLTLTQATRAWRQAALDGDVPSTLATELPAWLSALLVDTPSRPDDDGTDRAALVSALAQPASVDLRVNLLSTKREAAQALLKAEGVDTQPTPYSPWGLRLTSRVPLQATTAMTQGLVAVQDEGSQLIALLVDAKRHEQVADFCAGGGGKTLALGAAMRNTGRLMAIDTSASRLADMKLRLTAAGLSNVYALAIADEHDARLQRLQGKMHKVLVDAPCTGLGTVRRSPELKWRTKPQDVVGMAAKQLSILTAAARLVAPGGRLVYATCSLLREENEAVVEAFAAEHANFASLDAHAVLAAAKVERADGLVRQGCLRLWPHRHGTDGFFAAVLTRRT